MFIWIIVIKQVVITVCISAESRNIKYSWREQQGNDDTGIVTWSYAAMTQNIDIDGGIVIEWTADKVY